MDEVSTYLYNYAMKHHIGFIMLNDVDNDWPSLAVPEANMMFINTSWKKQNELPLVIAHEIGHMLNGDTCYMYDQSTIGKIKAENEANKVGIELLIQYCIDNDIQFTSYIMFLQKFAIPLKYEYIVRKKMSSLRYFRHPF